MFAWMKSSEYATCGFAYPNFLGAREVHQRRELYIHATFKPEKAMSKPDKDLSAAELKQRWRLVRR